MITDSDTLAALRARLPDFLAAVGVELQRKGGRLVGRCPIHDDRSPSFAVFGRGHDRAGCFPCNFTGDVFAVSKWLGRSSTFPEAIRDVATAVGLPVAASLPMPKSKPPLVAASSPDPEPGTRAAIDPKADMKNRTEFEEAHAKARRELFEACQRKTITALLIAKGFGIDLDTLRQLTFASDALGIEDGKLLYLYETGAKVRNSPGKHPRFYFTHGRAVRPWRWHFAARPDVQTVIVSEGESDAIALIHAGIEDLFPDDGNPGRAVVACPGASFPEEWGKLFRQKHVVLFFDFDEAGVKGARRAASIIAKHAASVRIVTSGKEDA